MFSLDKMLDAAEPQGHFVQLYNPGDDVLIRNVSRYLFEGWKRGEGLLIIASEEHIARFPRELARLGADTESALETGCLVLLDADQTLNQFMINGQPDWSRFRNTVEPAMLAVRAQGCESGLRAYGEMVGILWKAGQYSAAMRLEQYWNDLLKTRAFTLFCAYPIDIFEREFQTSSVDALLRDHTHLLPTGVNSHLENAVNRAMDEVLGPKAAGLRSLIKPNHRPSWAAVPSAESMILWIRNNLPHEADEILSAARQNYETLHSPAGC